MMTHIEASSKEAPEESPLNYNSRVLIIDGLNMFIRCFSASPLMDDDGNHIGGSMGFLRSLSYLIKEIRPTRCVIVFDGQGGSLKRKGLYSEYKGHRSPNTRLNRTYDFNSPEEEKESAKKQLLTLIELLSHTPVQLVSVDYVEADDVIAYISSHIINDLHGNVIIVSTDKDFLQLVNSNRTVFHPMKKVYLNEEVVKDSYGVYPCNMLWYRAFMGDTSDNIKGITGVGPKTLLKNIPSFALNTPITRDIILQECLNEKGKAKNKTCQKIIDGCASDIIYRNLKLMTLEVEAMSGINKIKILQNYDSYSPKFDKMQLTKLLTRSKLIPAFSDYSNWIHETFYNLMMYGEAHGRVS